MGVGEVQAFFPSCCHMAQVSQLALARRPLGKVEPCTYQMKGLGLGFRGYIGRYVGVMQRSCLNIGESNRTENGREMEAGIKLAGRKP